MKSLFQSGFQYSLLSIVSRYFYKQTKNEIMKIFGYILGFLILAYLALCFIGPKEFQASRSIEIDAPANAIYQNAFCFERH